VEDMLKQIKKELAGLIVGEEKLKGKTRNIRFRVVIFGLLSVLVMAVSTYLQLTYLKRFFRNKKLI